MKSKQNRIELVTRFDSGASGDDGFSGHKAVQIVKINEDDHSFTLDEDALNKILNNERIKDRPVCVVSVAGKSGFFLSTNIHWLQRGQKTEFFP